ncbi:MAG: nicotinate-nicotinamide nucleotide adenylyltransferase [Erysipelotrichaceae bacterium]|nr:nicotinate-nicotinamide nucleotide adenylyltransferase [Erysipelotrichaceae bacterium]
MRIGVYCGSFNPVHKGHIRIANECLDSKLVDVIFIIPTGNYWNKNDLMDLDKRISLLRYYEDRRIRVAEQYSDYQYTCQIFKQLEKDYPYDEKVLILGADNIVKFDEWKEYQYLLRYDFIIIKRDDLDRTYIENRMKELGKDNYQILDIDNIDISSTFIRENLDDYDKIKDLIDPHVYRFLIMERMIENAAPNN